MISVGNQIKSLLNTCSHPQPYHQTDERWFLHLQAFLVLNLKIWATAAAKANLQCTFPAATVTAAVAAPATLVTDSRAQASEFSAWSCSWTLNLQVWQSCQRLLCFYSDFLSRSDLGRYQRMLFSKAGEYWAWIWFTQRVLSYNLKMAETNSFPEWRTFIIQEVKLMAVE